MENKIESVFSEIESKARKDGAEVEMIISSSESFSTNFQKGKLNKYSFDQAISAGIRVLYGQGAGYSSSENTSPEALKSTYEEALQSAKDLSKEAKASHLTQKLYQSKNKPSEMNLVSDSFDQMEIPAKLKIAETLEKAALEFDSRVQNVPYSGYGESKSTRSLFSSTGLRLSSNSAGVSAYSYALSKTGDDLKTGHSSGFFRKPQNLNARQMAQEAAQKSIALLGAEQPQSGKYTVVLANEVAASLMGFLTHHLSAKTLDQGTSLFAGKLGEKILSEKITVLDDPFQSELMGARAYDGEGAASQSTVTFENGILKSYLSNSYLSEKLKIPHTANASRSGGEMGVSSTNTIVSQGRSSLQDLLKADTQVLFITSVDALHSGFKESTLDFSLPAYGFLYEAGEQVKPLHQMVMSGNLLQILKSVSDLSDRRNNDGGSVQCPDFLIPEMSIAGRA